MKPFSSYDQAELAALMARDAALMANRFTKPTKPKTEACGRHRGGISDDVCAYAKDLGRPFTLHQISEAMPGFTRNNLSAAISKLKGRGRLVIVGMEGGLTKYKWGGK